MALWRLGPFCETKFGERFWDGLIYIYIEREREEERKREREREKEKGREIERCGR